MDNEQTTIPPADQAEGQQSSAEAWREVGQQFAALGESLAAAFRAAWEREDTRRHVQEMQKGVETMVDEVSQAIKQTAASPEGQQVRQQVEKATASAREAGERAFQEAQPHLLAALRDIDAELQKMISITLRQRLFFVGMLLLTLIILRPAPVTGQDDFPDVCAEDPGNLVRNCEFDDGLSHWHTFVEAGDPPEFSVEHSNPACDSPKCPALRIWAEDWFIGGIYQQVSGVVPGVTYWANVIWMVYNPAGQLDNTVGRRIGIDPTGGTDPMSPNVVWSQDLWKSFASCPYKICHELQVEAVAQNATITVFLRIEDTWKNRREEFPWVDDDYFQAPESFWIDDPGMVRAVADPTPTPTPTPTPAPISTTISTNGGGSLTSNDAARSTTIQVPAGAVTGSTVITYAYHMELPAGDLVGIDRFFHLEATQDGTSTTRFSRPVTIAVRYPVSNPLKEDTIHLYWLSGTNWITDGVATTVRTTSSLTSTTDHFSLFAVLGETNWVHLPTIMKWTFDQDTP